MIPKLLIPIILPIFIGCNAMEKKKPVLQAEVSTSINTNPFQYVHEIPVPEGFERVESDDFGQWLRKRPLKKDSRVFLYNGELKSFQGAQFAVLDIPVGNKDLQQCADAVMRLRAEYLFDQRNFDQIVFHDNAKKAYEFKPPYNQERLEKYLETVYSFCGTLSLSAELNTIHDLADPAIGDVLIHGGSPGHAAIILDKARNAAGEVLVLIANSYMPAQSIHIVRNVQDEQRSPWIKVDGRTSVTLPQWTFSAREIKRF